MGAIGIVPLPALWLVSDALPYLIAIQVVAGVAWAALEYATQLSFFESLDERDRTLGSLATTLGGAGLLTILIAFGVDWVLAGTTLKPIQRITRTAQAIGDERLLHLQFCAVGEVHNLRGSNPQFIRPIMDLFV